MAKTLVRNVTQTAITLPQPYIGIIPPGAAVVIDDLPDVVIAALYAVPEVENYLTISEVSDSSPTTVPVSRQTAAAAAVETVASTLGPLDMNGQKIFNLADPTDAQDAATQKYVIDYVATHGGGGGGGGGTVTSVSSANSYLTVTNGTTTPTLTVEVGAEANKVAAGNDTRFVNSVPSVTGAVVYDSGVAYTKTAAGAAGQVLTVGAGLIPEWQDATSAPSGNAGGDLSGTYPDPTIKDGVIDDANVSATAAIATSKLSGALTDITNNGLAAFVDAATKAAHTYYVATNGNDLNDGSFYKPYATIQAAHDAAASEHPGDEYVLIDVGPGDFTGAVNITRKNTLIQGTGHRAEMFSTKVVGSITVNASTATQKNTHIVGIAGCFVAPSSGTTTPAVKVTGSGLFSVVINDCYLYTTNASATASAFACDATNASRPRIIINDSIIATDAAGPAPVQLDRGDVRMDNTQIRHNSSVTLGAAGSCVVVANDATLWLNTSLVESRTRGAAISATGASAGIKLLMTVGSVTTAYAGPEDTTHGITVTNTAGVAAFLWQTSFNVADVSAAVYAVNGTSPVSVVVYSELSFQPGTNSKIASGVTLTPMTETHGSMVLPSLTASLPLKLDANKQVTAAAIALDGSEVTGTLTTGKGGTGNATLGSAGAVAYSDGTKVTYTAVGTAGYPLLSDAGNAPAFGQLDLGTAAVKGTLPKGNQEAQDVGGDLSGSTATATVTKIQNNPVQSGALAAGDAGKALVWSGSSWEAATITPGGGGGGGGGGLTYYMNYTTAGQATLPPSTVSVKQLSLSYNTSGQVNTGAITAPQGSYATLAEFVTDLNLPGETTIPPGNWDIAAYLLTSGANNTYFRARVFKWDGTTETELSTSPSDDVDISSAGISPNLFTASVYIQQTTLTALDRIVIRLEITRTTPSARTVTGYFNGNTPSHVHTTLGAPGGTGLVKVAAGVVQSPATLLFDADVDAAAGIAVTKLAKGTASQVLHGGGASDNYWGAVALGTEVSGTLAVDHGGTGLTTGTSGGVLYYSSATTLAASALLATNELMLGGGAGAAPTTLGDLGTSTKVLHGNDSGVPTWGAVDLSADVTDTLPVANGGTNSTSVGSAGSVAYSTGTAYNFSAQGTAGQVLLSGGNAAPTWTTTLPYTAGGTGSAAVPTANQVPYGNSTSNGLVYTSGGAVGEVLGIGSSGNPEWMSNGSAPSGPATGDLSSNYPNPTVAKINGTTITTAGGALSLGAVLRTTASGTADWGTVDLGSTNAVSGTLLVTRGGTGNNSILTNNGVVYYDASGLKYTSTTAATDGQLLVGRSGLSPLWKSVSGDASLLNTGALTVIGLRGRTVASTAPTAGQVLGWNNSTTQWEPTNTLGTSGTDVTTAGRDVCASTQVTPAALTTIPISTSVIRLSGNTGTVDYTGTFPTLAVSGIADGTRVTLINESAFAITIGDDTTYPGTKIQLGGPTTRTLSQYTAISFTYDSTVGFWVESGVGGSGIVQSIASSAPTAANGLIVIDSTVPAIPKVGIRGLTGNDPGTAGGVPYFSDAKTLSSMGAGTAGQYLKSNAASAPTWADVPYDVAGMIAGQPGAGATVFYFKATRAFTLSATNTDHVFTANTSATGSSAFTVTRTRSGSTVTILTATFAASGTVASISAVANNSIAVGDIIKVVAPVSQDATLSDIYWTLTGKM